MELLQDLIRRWHTLPGHVGKPVINLRGLREVDSGICVRLAGVVTHRPMTAGGMIFLGCEDEYGLMNVAVSKGLWTRQRQLILATGIAVVRGIVRKENPDAASITADLIENVKETIGDATLTLRPIAYF